MPVFNESNTIEAMLLETATQCGWEYATASELGLEPDQVFVRRISTTRSGR